MWPKTKLHNSFSPDIPDFLCLLTIPVSSLLFLCLLLVAKKFFQKLAAIEKSPVQNDVSKSILYILRPAAQKNKVSPPLQQKMLAKVNQSLQLPIHLPLELQGESSAALKFPRRSSYGASSRTPSAAII